MEALAHDDGRLQAGTTLRGNSPFGSSGRGDSGRGAGDCPSNRSLEGLVLHGQNGLHVEDLASQRAIVEAQQTTIRLRADLVEVQRVDDLQQAANTHATEMFNAVPSFSFYSRGSASSEPEDEGGRKRESELMSSDNGRDVPLQTAQKDALAGIKKGIKRLQARAASGDRSTRQTALQQRKLALIKGK
ncbi:uncharacterized protein MYCGRDRAFT_97799 [Zymoseptoria tritici IPO323]|uniref:Uncharacterized protein n=1 Tax=Zymoseptoria tritici (strain CBS 115943 / IPO323) TaxID=336722 RepID=F9XRE7_ZYMTI|nr:uncharacterized protein MYCGRDRAFT_97799 [Zymoseptoria tritici IPO323]EGP82124.1 hypothetical protein MYCGRDRAFT_97799 [Zymoseptoria tritici IPO323]